MRRLPPLSIALLATLSLLCQSCGAEPAASPPVAPPTKTPAVPPAAAPAGERPKDPTPAPAAAGKSVILISWDGLDRAVVKELLKDNKLPNLAALIKAGSFQEIQVKGHETETRPSHAEMLTGLSADVTGVRSNGEGDAVPVGTTIFERLKAAMGKDGVATIMVVGKAYVGTLVPDGSRPSIDTFDAASRRANVVGPLALAALEKHKRQRFMAFFHFLDPDSAGHGYGRDSQQYRQAAGLCDEWLGAMVELLKKEKLDGSTYFYVMVDHGFDVGGHQHHNAPDSWLATNDPDVARGGIIADVPATILARFGVDAAKLKPELLGKPLTGKPAAAEPKKAPEVKPEPVEPVEMK
jgi:hypothetical protein